MGRTWGGVLHRSGAGEGRRCRGYCDWRRGSNRRLACCTAGGAPCTRGCHRFRCRHRAYWLRIHHRCLRGPAPRVLASSNIFCICKEQDLWSDGRRGDVDYMSSPSQLMIQTTRCVRSLIQQSSLEHVCSVPPLSVAAGKIAGSSHLMWIQSLKRTPRKHTSTSPWRQGQSRLLWNPARIPPCLYG